MPGAETLSLPARRLAHRVRPPRRDGGARRTVPAHVAALILAVAAAGASTLAFRGPGVAAWSNPDFVVLGALAAAICISEQFPVELHHRAETMYLALTDSIWTAALLLARPSVLTFAVAAGIIVGLTVRRVAPHKVAFNVGQYLVSLTLAQVVYSAIAGSAGPLTARSIVAVTIGMAAYAIVSSALVALVISLAERKRFLDILLPPLAVNALHYGGNVTLGILGAVAWTMSPLGLFLVLFPLVVFYIAYRTLIRNLREGERLRELIVENASDGIFVEAPGGGIVSWNPAMERITGLTAGEVVGKSWPHALALAAGSSEDVVAAAASEEVREPGSTWFAPIVRRDGTSGWVLCSASAIQERDGKVKATVVVVHDVTAEREAEQLKADFVATISHELRTPLTPLKGFLTSLMQGMVNDGGDARREYYRIMLRQTNRLERLVSDLLEVSRIESSQGLGGTGPVDLCSPVIEQIHVFSEEYPKRSIRFDAPEGQLLVEGDGSRIGLIASNLIANALKYSPPDRPVEVSAFVEEGMATISVKDEGPGIALPEQARIFDRFYQIESHLTRKAGGVGLGLYICKRLVEGMSGRLSVESKPGHGSTFSFSLPLARKREFSGSSR